MLYTRGDESLYGYQLDSSFADFLDEIYLPVNVGGIEYAYSRVLYEVDPVRYRCEFADWTAEEGWE